MGIGKKTDSSVGMLKQRSKESGFVLLKGQGADEGTTGCVVRGMVENELEVDAHKLLVWRDSAGSLLGLKQEDWKRWVRVGGGMSAEDGIGT